MNPNELRERFRNLVSAKPRQWYRVVNQAAGPTQIHIYNDIGMQGITAEDLVDDLAKINGPVELRLNSGGGEIFDGIAIYNALCARDVAVYIDGLAGSAASFIAMAASPGKLFMAKTATMMIHDGQAMAMGNASELTSMVDVLNRESQKIASIYADRTGKDVEYFRGKMKDETWYNADEALEEGLVDVIFDPRTGQDASQGRPAVHAAAGGARALRNAVPATKQLGDGWVQDPDGTVRFDPDGDGDDDSKPETDTDHGYWDEDGNQIKEIPPCPAGVMSSDGKPPKPGKNKPPKPPKPGKNAAPGHELRNADVDNSDWDASKAWHNGAEADDPEAFYSGICAGKRTGDPTTQSAWALPYKYHPSDPPNAGGVRAALAVLGGARGGVQGLINKTEARETLEAAMKKINPDYEKSGNQMDGGLLAAVLTQGLKGAAK
jgi:ATP-dependent protease ClpP protease subunit